MVGSLRNRGWYTRYKVMLLFVRWSALLVFLLLLAACTAEEAPAERSTGQALAGDPVLNIAHRGAAGRAPENTFAAYDLALEHGADYIEQDVQMTKDSVLVVFHDETLGRAARGPEENCTGLLIEKTLAQLRTCDVGTPFNDEHPHLAREVYEGLKIPTLEEVFRRYQQRTNFYIDVKSPGTEEALLRLMKEYGLLEPENSRRALVVSFKEDSLREFHKLAPALPLMRAYHGNETDESIMATLDATQEYAAGINPWKDDVSSRLVEKAHARCLYVHPYTANDRSEMERLISANVDGIFTKFPGKLEETLGERSTDAKRAGLSPKNRASCRP